MEKISLLLLIAKKTLIGSVIAGILGFGGTDWSFAKVKNMNDEKTSIEKKIGQPNPRRPTVPGQ